MFFQNFIGKSLWTAVRYQLVKEKVCSKNMFSNIQIGANLLVIPSTLRQTNG